MKKARGKKILITAGPTRAYLDRVRFLSNFSTGKLGFRLCQALLKSGHQVHAVVGPTAFPFVELPLARLDSIETTREMRECVLRACKTFKPDIAIFSAAVLDFEPAKREKGKVSSKKSAWTIRLKPTPKIIDEVGKKFPKIRRVGFKLEWERPKGKDSIMQSVEILESKRLDALLLNYLSEIETKAHPAVFISRTGQIVEARSKDEIAQAISQWCDA